MRKLSAPTTRRRCPFYGFHWPAQGSNLIERESSECGLDLDRHGPCQMEMEQMPVDFDRCSLRLEWKNLIEAGKRYIRFHGAGLPRDGVSLEKWQDLIMRRD